MKSPVKVGILIDSFSQPSYIYSIIKRIHEANFASIKLIIRNIDNRPFSDLLNRNKNYILYYLYEFIDCKICNFIFRKLKSAFIKKNIRDILKDVKCIEVEPVRTKYCDYFPDEKINQI